MTVDREARLPPGDVGLPYLGEMPRMVRDSFAFIEDRVRRHGPIFRTRLLGRNTAIVTGPDAAALFVDDDRISRGGAMLPHIQALFGGLSLPVMDGPAHHARKEVVMAAFTSDALAAYLPTIERLVAATLARIAVQDDTPVVPALKRLGMEVLVQAVLGFAAGPDLERLVENYARVMRGLVSLPLPLPGTAYARARKALGIALEAHLANIHRHQQASGPQASSPQASGPQASSPQASSPQASSIDGLSRMLAARERIARSGEDVTLDALAVECHHLLIAGMIVWSWFGAGLVVLDEHPDIRERLDEEIARVAPGGMLDLETLAAMPYLARVVDEIRRHTPVLQLAWGRARRTFSFGGYTVPENWMVLWGVRASHMRPNVYPEPERFDPDRFSPERAEHKSHPCAFVPNGAGERLGHLCAGYQLAPLMVSVFLIQLVRGYAWEIPRDQDLDFDFTTAPPQPRDGLRARLRPKHPPEA